MAPRPSPQCESRRTGASVIPELQLYGSRSVSDDDVTRSHRGRRLCFRVTVKSRSGDCRPWTTQYACSATILPTSAVFWRSESIRHRSTVARPSSPRLSVRRHATEVRQERAFALKESSIAFPVALLRSTVPVFRSRKNGRLFRRESMATNPTFAQVDRRAPGGGWF
jgi:hypothetical protein